MHRKRKKMQRREIRAGLCMRLTTYKWLQTSSQGPHLQATCAVRPFTCVLQITGRASSQYCTHLQMPVLAKHMKSPKIASTSPSMSTRPYSCIHTKNLGTSSSQNVLPHHSENNTNESTTRVVLIKY